MFNIQIKAFALQYDRECKLPNETGIRFEKNFVFVKKKNRPLSTDFQSLYSVITNMQYMLL